MQSPNYGNEVVEEEEDNIVLVRYDDDPGGGGGLQPILASLATPDDPFARAIVTQDGWNRQIAAVFQSDPTLGPLKVVDFWDPEESMPLNTVTNVGLIGETLARLNLSDARSDGVVCGILTKATNDLQYAVEAVENNLGNPELKKIIKSLRYERASGFFLPVWTLMDQMKHLDANAMDTALLSGRFLRTGLSVAQRKANKSASSLLNLVSSNLNLHLVHMTTRRSGAFGRMNPWLHKTLLQLFDRRRVVQIRPVLMKHVSASVTDDLDVKNVIKVKRVRVKIPQDLVQSTNDIKFTSPKASGPEGNLPVLMDGIEISLSQHDYTVKSQAKKKIKFKTGTHAAIHLRRLFRKGIKLGEEDARGNTLSFLYRWPEMNYLAGDSSAVEIDTVKIVIYGSGKVNWWEDYYRPSPARHDNLDVMPYPVRRVYIADEKTWIEYHDIMQLIFAQALYGHFAKISDSIEIIQNEFSTLVSGALGKIGVMVVMEARENIQEPYLRVSRKGEKLAAETAANTQKIIREFPQMQDVLLTKELSATWNAPGNRKTTRGASIRINKRFRREDAYSEADTKMSLPPHDLIFKQNGSSQDGHQGIIGLRLHDMCDINSIGAMTWFKAGKVGLEYFDTESIPDKVFEEVLQLAQSPVAPPSPSLPIPQEEEEEEQFIETSTGLDSEFIGSDKATQTQSAFLVQNRITQDDDTLAWMYQTLEEMSKEEHEKIAADNDFDTLMNSLHQEDEGLVD